MWFKSLALLALALVLYCAPQARGEVCTAEPRVFLDKVYSGPPPFSDFFCFEEDSDLIHDVHVVQFQTVGCENRAVAGTTLQLCQSNFKILYKSNFVFDQEVLLKNTVSISGLTLLNGTRYYALLKCDGPTAKQRALIEDTVPTCTIPCPVTSPNILAKEGDISAADLELLEEFGDGRICKDDLHLALKISLSVLLAFLMLGMGAAITFKDMNDIVHRNWQAFIVGMLGQYFVMPLLSLAFAYIFSFDDVTAIGTILIGCSPGGVASQLFTFWAHGSIPLSITMTFASTLLSFGMLPLLTYIYTLPFSHNALDEMGGIEMPWLEMFLALLIVVVPVLIGAGIRQWRGPRFGRWLERSGLMAGACALMAAFILSILINEDFFDTAAEIWVAAALLPFCGFFFGYGLAWLLRRDVDARRTIAFEVGIQNSSLTITLIIWSFVGTLQRDMLAFPLLYSIFSIVDGIILCTILRIMNHFHVANFHFKKLRDGDSPKAAEMELGSTKKAVDDAKAAEEKPAAAPKADEEKKEAEPAAAAAAVTASEEKQAEADDATPPPLPPSE